MPHYLVVADQTIGGKPLQNEIAARHRKGDARFTVLVPATPPKEGLTFTDAEAHGLAQDRLERVLLQIRRLGAQGVGAVADQDPFEAIRDAARETTFDEIILSAPSKRSGWMKPNLPAKVQQAFKVPVAFVAGEREDAARLAALSVAPLISALPNRQARALAKLTMVESVREGTSIIEEGSPGSDLYVILDGRVRVLVGGVPVNHLVVGDFFGEVSLLEPGPRSATVVAEAPTRCLILQGTEVRAEMARDPELAAKLLQAAASRLRDLSREVRDAMTSILLDGDLLEKLAEAAHVQYCADELAKGASWGESSDDYLVRHEPLASYAGSARGKSRGRSTLVAYEKLPEQIKEQNRDLVRDIPKKLAAAGYVMRRLEPVETPVGFADDEIETLAEREHDRWIRLKLAQDWSHAPKRDDDRRRHPGLVPWSELENTARQSRYGMEGASRLGPGVLPESEKQKDRAQIRAIGAILARVGYRPAKASPSA